MVSKSFIPLELVNRLLLRHYNVDLFCLLTNSLCQMYKSILFSNVICIHLPTQVHNICYGLPVPPATWMCLRNLFHDRSILKGSEELQLKSNFIIHAFQSRMILKNSHKDKILRTNRILMMMAFSFIIRYIIHSGHFNTKQCFIRTNRILMMMTFSYNIFNTIQYFQLAPVYHILHIGGNFGHI